MSLTTKCQGCGTTLQMEHKNELGYVQDSGHPYCQACFRLMHYGEVHSHMHPEDLPVLPEHALILMMSSVLHIDKLFFYPVYRYQPKATFVYVINQIDLLPKQTNLELFLENIRSKAKKMRIPYLDIILMSSKNPYDIKNLKDYIHTLNHKHIYLIGVQNSGKTTMFKALTEAKEPLAFKKAGLTQGVLIRPFEDHVIYDMPGLYQSGYMHEILPYQTYKDLIPDTEIHPKAYQIKAGQMLMIEGLFMIGFHHEAFPVLYLSKTTKIHKTRTEKLTLWLSEKATRFSIWAPTYETQAFKISKGRHQVTFADIGFMHVQGPLTIDITYPKGISVTLSEALFQ